ncbi:DUF1553 domain-containing protein [Paraglaciecola aquimarina]|uniref:DUF1553 domain-containing protein n=1 Tax=Paraglaciecola aquimarina TaxID=1235557 RepID=A0ABU3SYN0_9ALTE|nr:DUF1553 domain-containing protein [Paraglaciecola aquimarina]MDU0355123.1 DUF1553 domain-containing protein [Paraglaciecola aquimarina]
MKPRYLLSLISATVLLTACGQEQEQNFAEPLPEVVDFNYHVKPILSDTCYLCHGPDKSNAKAGLTLSNFDDATTHITDNGVAALIPGNAEGSEAFQRIMSDDENIIMPPPNAHLTLSARDKAIIKKWIDQGAEYKKHWALISPVKVTPPTLKAVEWANNEIDHFIGKKIEDKNLQPNSQADKESLIRRLSFDLTGLPPSTEQLDNYLSNNSKDATPKLIDELMASPAFGERLATEWLDVARYADTHGYSTDYYRDMSPYRDWVIESFNQNRPFDEFITWQVAGDLLPNATEQQILATAFNRVHAQNGEGGIVNEEFRVEYVKDRVQTIGTGLLGMTMHCAQCHDHKYDPISAKDYYSTFAFFNNLDESGQISYDPNDMPVPTLMLPTAEQKQTTEQLTAQVAELENSLRSFKTVNAEFKQWLDKNEGKVTNKGKDALIAHFDFSSKDSTKTLHNKVDKKSSGKVMFGGKPKKKTGPKLVHIQDSNRSAIKLNGDDILFFPTLNGYHRAKPFSLSIDVKIPTDTEDGVLVHYNKAGILYNFKGFDLGIEDGHWMVRFAHSYPYNAIKIDAREPVAREQWTNVAITYDGSSTAAGLKLYINGELAQTDVERDNLYKDIEHTRTSVKEEMGIKIGARWRSKGLPNVLVDNFKVYDRDLTAIEMHNAQSEQPVTASMEALLAVFNKTVNKDYINTSNQLQTLRHQQNQMIEQFQEIMVMQEMEQPRQAYVLERGGYANHGEKVSPGVPERFYPFDPDWPKNRIGLAKWLTAPKHPLVSRVIVNRYWQLVFGTGLVRTPEDFGNQGELPTHPLLLDWLAVEFVESGWDVKHIIKLMVSSATYQQSSKTTEQLNESDPENRLYARGPSGRLTAEMIRDNALAASDLLVDKIGGESVRPYQPKDIWKMNNKTYERGDGEDLYRRSMYTIYKRSAPPPNLMAFDAPSRSYSVGTRQETSTPLQALALLNDPQIIEASKVLSAKLMRQFDSPTEILSQAYRKITSRIPSDAELTIIEQMYQQTLTDFTDSPQQVAELLDIGDTKVSAQQNTAELAALTSVTNILMNHDAAVIKKVEDKLWIAETFYVTVY